MQENDPHSNSSGKGDPKSSRLYPDIPSKSLGIMAHHNFTDSLTDSMHGFLRRLLNIVRRPSFHALFEPAGDLEKNEHGSPLYCLEGFTSKNFLAQ